MKLRKLGRSDLHLTPVGLGTWAMGGGDWKFGWGPQDDALSIRTIHEALDLGVNWLDTAPVYGLGHCEDIVGRALKELKGRRPIISTKCERCWDEERQIIPRLKRASIRREIEDSLRRLGVDVIDMYQIHWPQPDEDIEEGWAAIAELVQEGKVRWAGVSNFNVAQLKRLQPIHPVAFLQPPYSMLNRGIEAELIPYCEEHDIGLITYSPMQKGLLSGKVTPEWAAALPADDHRRADPQFNEPLLTKNIALAKGLTEIAHRYGRNSAELAIAWVLRQPRVTAAIVGARKPGQIKDTVFGGK
ncbi:MAG: hypothetical protein RLZZ412_2052, partial [Verrucomicrobiota bacterium]